MTEPELERWLADEHADPELRRLLEAGSNERPSTQALRMAPLVISSLLAVQTTAAAAPVAAGAARHALTTAALKWFAGGVLVSAAAVSASQGLAPAPGAPLAPAPTTVTTLARRSVSAAQRREEALPAAPLAPVAEPISSAPQTSTATKTKTMRVDVAREVALLDAARSALSQGNARRALDSLSELERLPARSLVPEATVLRVRALLLLNDLETARKVATTFVTAAPGSPQASVLRGLFAEPLATKTTTSATSGTKPAIQTSAGKL